MHAILWGGLLWFSKELIFKWAKAHPLIPTGSMARGYTNQPAFAPSITRTLPCRLHTLPAYFKVYSGRALQPTGTARNSLLAIACTSMDCSIINRDSTMAVFSSAQSLDFGWNWRWCDWKVVCVWQVDVMKKDWSLDSNFGSEHSLYIIN